VQYFNIQPIQFISPYIILHVLAFYHFFPYI